jgi:Zn finger protein HypA/HybF involved in hydrogenase expression
MAKITIIKTPLTIEQKRIRALEYIEDTFNDIDMDEFIKKDIFNEYVQMKCLNCDYEETIDFDIIYETSYSLEDSKIVFYCPKCDKEKLVPLSFYERKKSLK